MRRHLVAVIAKDDRLGSAPAVHESSGILHAQIRSMEPDLTAGQIALLRAIGMGFGDSQWVMQSHNDAVQTTALVKAGFIHQWDNQYIVTDLGRAVLGKWDANVA